MKLIVAHPVDLMHTGIRTTLGHSEFGVAGTCQSLTDLKAALETEAPDAIILGEQLDPDLAVWDLVEQVQLVSPARIVLLGSVSDGFLIQDLFKMGIMAYLYQYDPLSGCLIDALYAVRRGREYLSPTATSEYLCATRSPRPELTLDIVERKILRCIADGDRPKEIAPKLNEPARYVYDIIERLRRRFGVASTAELVLLAASSHLI
jgi:DNA-binding NarL/FixJ family response regulator